MVLKYSPNTGNYPTYNNHNHNNLSGVLYSPNDLNTYLQPLTTKQSPKDCNVKKGRREQLKKCELKVLACEYHKD